MKLVLALTLIAIVACSHKPDAPDTPNSPPPAAGATIEAKQVAAEQEASYVTEILFPKSSFQLSESSKSKIRELKDTAQKVGKIEEIHVISWADQEYPSVHTKKLPKNERDLAKKRNQEIQNLLAGDLEKSKIKLHTMAERPNALSSILGSKDTRIKKSLEMAGIPTTDTSVKFPAKASRSIVMIILSE